MGPIHRTDLFLLGGEEVNEAVSLILRHFPDMQAVYLFGSYGTPYQRKDSDVDLALLLPPLRAIGLRNLVAHDCLYEMMDLMDCEVDLINMRMVDTAFQHQIIQTGRVWFDSDPYERASFEVLVMGKYQKLNQERADILADIGDTGKVLL